MEMDKVGIIVTTYNRPEELKNCLTAVIQQAKEVTTEAIVIVVDDGSKLDNIEASNKADYYYWQENKGYRLSTARNIGARIAISEGATVLIFLDGDIIVHPFWLEAMIEGTREGLTFGEINGRAPDIVKLRNRPWLAATGGNMATTTKLWNEIGEFDSDYDGNWGVEDTDWAYRALDAGAKLVQQNANATHRKHKSSRDWRKEQAINWEKFEKKFPDMIGSRPNPSRTDEIVLQESTDLASVMSIPAEVTEGVWLITATRGRPEEPNRWKTERFLWGLETVIADDNKSPMVSNYPEGAWAACTGGIGTSGATKQAIEHAVSQGAKYIIELDDHDTLKRGPEDILEICKTLKNGVDYAYGNYVLHYTRRRNNPCQTLEYEPGMLASRGMPWMGVKAYSVEAYNKAGGYIAEDFPGGDYSLALRMEIAGCSFKKIESLWTVCPMEVDSLTSARKGETHDKIREYQQKYLNEKNQEKVGKST